MTSSSAAPRPPDAPVPEARLRVTSIALWGYHGCERCEAEDGAPFAIDLDAVYTEPADALNDDFRDRPDYALMVERAVALFTARRWKLVEPLAASIAETLLAEFSPLVAVTVTIRKLAPVIPVRLAHAEIAVTRRRAAHGERGSSDRSPR